MSIDAVLWARLQTISDAEGKGVLAAMAVHADKWGICRESSNTLAKVTGKSQRTVKRHLKLLVTAELIALEKSKRADGSNDVNAYLLFIDQGKLVAGAFHPPDERLRHE